MRAALKWKDTREAQRGRHGEDGARIAQLFGLISVILESHVQSSALPGEIPEMLRIAAMNSPETTAVVEELGGLLRRYGEPDRSGMSADVTEDLFAVIAELSPRRLTECHGPPLS